MPAPEKILVRAVNWLGDAVMSTPALRRLREARPTADITLLTTEKLAGLWQDHPTIDRVITFGAADTLPHVVRQLRLERFAIAIAFPNSMRSALEIFFARIPMRIGYRGAGRGLLFTHPVPAHKGAVRMHKRSHAEIERRIARNMHRETFSPSAHHAHHYLNLIRTLGADSSLMPPVLRVNDAEVAAIRARFDLSDNCPLFALNAGAEYGPAKRWPAARFIEAAARLHRETRCRWIILGGNGDRDLAEAVASELRARTSHDAILNVAGQTSLRDLCALLKICALLLTNDTGPMHVAAALGTPVIVPFGSTSPELTGPFVGNGEWHQIVVGEASCAPCFLRRCPVDFRCMGGISVDAVVTAVNRAFAQAHKRISM